MRLLGGPAFFGMTWMRNVAENLQIEIDFWRTSKHESPGSWSVRNIINKASDAAVFLESLARHRKSLFSEGKVIELGGGQGWASCIYKAMYPKAHVIATDISKYAIASIDKWEGVFGASVDNVYACKSYETAEADGSVDQVFCFSAAHHFMAHRKTLAEIARILKPGGLAFFFYEPVTSSLFYPLVYRWVNAKRQDVPEDVIVSSKVAGIAGECGLECKVDYFPSLTKRGPLETIYFSILAHSELMQKCLPATANLVFQRK